MLSVVKPKSLRERLNSDLEFSSDSLQKYFKGFMKHVVRLSEKFELLDLGLKIAVAAKGERRNLITKRLKGKGKATMAQDLPHLMVMTMEAAIQTRKAAGESLIDVILPVHTPFVRRTRSFVGLTIEMHPGTIRKQL